MCCRHAARKECKVDGLSIKLSGQMFIVDTTTIALENVVEWWR